MKTLILILVISLPVILILCGSWILINWIRFSWIHTENSRNITGGELTRELLDGSGMVTTEIKKSIWYKKYWNHNKRKDTYRLRNWTYNRKSIWTMTEAMQQAYVTIQRKIDKKQFYLFRFPFILNIIGTLIVVGGIYLYFNHPANEGINSKTVIALLVILAGAVISSIGIVIMRWIIYKKVLPILEKMGFSDFERKAFKNIYLSFLVYSIVLMIINIIQLFLRLVGVSSRNKK